ncbi:putative O-methyltransferase [Salinisphaera sp. S4-8]|uniref:O-methyltransferase n=1 Tax=Salinisphaera sp. S4-8 TaxID=633357 RepID=UPI003340A256
MNTHPWKKLRRRIKTRRTRAEDIAVLRPFVDQLLQTMAIAEQNNPAQLSHIAFELFLRQKQDVTRVKAESIEPRHERRFERFLAEVKNGHSPLTGADAIDVLHACNYFLGLDDAFDDQGLDISSHFRMSSSFSTKGRMLYSAVKILRPGAIVEIGTAYGMSAGFLLSAARRFAPDAVLHTIEAGEPQFTLAQESLLSRHGDRVRCYKGLSMDVLPEVADNAPAVDLVFHDGAHDGQIFQSDFAALLPSLQPGAVMVFDDIRWFDKHVTSQDPGCYSGWTAITQRPEIALAAEIGSNVGVAMIGRS